MSFNKEYNEFHEKRFNRTLSFLNKVAPPPQTILDLGPANRLSELMKKEGYTVSNTPPNQDLDYEYDIVKNNEYDIVTGFEIFEHLVNPFGILQAITAKKLAISVPLNLWFASAYWNEKDPYDRHFHEFEPRQLKMLLNKAGWEIKTSEKWKSFSNQIGFRPLMRRFTYRYFIVYCERITV